MNIIAPFQAVIDTAKILVPPHFTEKRKGHSWILCWLLTPAEKKGKTNASSLLTNASSLVVLPGMLSRCKAIKLTFSPQDLKLKNQKGKRGTNSFQQGN